MTGNLDITMTADEQDLLKAQAKLIQQQEKMIAELKKTKKEGKAAGDEIKKFGEHASKVDARPTAAFRQEMNKLTELTKGAGTKHQQLRQAVLGVGTAHTQAFGADALSRMATFAASAFGVQQVFSKLVSFMQEADQELTDLSSRQLESASGIGSLAQLTNDPQKLRAMREEARKTFLEGGAATLDQAARLQFALESAGMPEMRADYSALQAGKIVEDAATMANAAAALQSALGTAETGSFRALTSKAFGASLGAPASAEAILQAAAGAGAQAKRIGLTDEELLAATATVSKTVGASEAGTLLKALAKSIEVEGIGGGYLDTGKTLMEQVQRLQQHEAEGVDIREMLGGRQEAITAYGLLATDEGRQRMAENLRNIEQAQAEDWFTQKLGLARTAMPEVTAAQMRAQAGARYQAASGEVATMRTVTDSLIDDMRATSREMGVPGVVIAGMTWQQRMKRMVMGDAAVAAQMLPQATPMAREQALNTMVAMQQAAGSLNQAAENLRNSSEQNITNAARANQAAAGGAVEAR